MIYFISIDYNIVWIDNNKNIKFLNHDPNVALKAY